MFNATIIENIKINDGLFRLLVKLDQAPKQPFLPGQYTTLGLPELQDTTGKKFLKRAYSICSSPENETELEFFIAKVEGGELTPRLFNLKESDRLLCGPKITGTFNLTPVPKDSHLIFVGTGTGLAPFMSMLRTRSVREEYSQIDLINGVRYETDFAYTEEIQSFINSGTQLRYHPIVSRPKGLWNGQTGRIQRLFVEKMVLVDPQQSHILLCGNPAMIEETKTLLESLGCKEHTKKEHGNIHIEKYW